MNVFEMPGSSRREFLGNTGRAVAASALAGVAIPTVHAGENHTIQIALVGCGGSRHRRRGQCAGHEERPGQARGHGRCVRAPAQEQLRNADVDRGRCRQWVAGSRCRGL